MWTSLHTKKTIACYCYYDYWCDYVNRNENKKKKKKSEKEKEEEEKWNPKWCWRRRRFPIARSFPCLCVYEWFPCSFFSPFSLSLWSKLFFCLTFCQLPDFRSAQSLVAYKIDIFACVCVFGSASHSPYSHSPYSHSRICFTVSPSMCVNDSKAMTISRSVELRTQVCRVNVRWSKSTTTTVVRWWKSVVASAVSNRAHFESTGQTDDSSRSTICGPNCAANIVNAKYVLALIQFCCI